MLLKFEYKLFKCFLLLKNEFSLDVIIGLGKFKPLVKTRFKTFDEYKFFNTCFTIYDLYKFLEIYYIYKSFKNNEFKII